MAAVRQFQVAVNAKALLQRVSGRTHTVFCVLILRFN
jgi:hypothetical protein